MNVKKPDVLSSIEESIIEDDLDRVWPIIVHRLVMTPEWPDIGKILFQTAVVHHSYKIMAFMLKTYKWLLTEDGPYKMTVFQLAIEYCNSYAIELFLQNDVQFNCNIDEYSYDILIDKAYKKLENMKTQLKHYSRIGYILRLKRIMKCLLEYPHNRYNQHGIYLEYDEDISEFKVSRNDNLDLNRLINDKTVLEIWINREIESAISGCQSSVYVQKIISSITRYLIKHVAVRQTVGLFVSANNLQAIDSKCHYLHCEIECHLEIKQMLEVSIQADKFVSVFDVLIASKDSLSQYIQNKKARRFIFSESFVKDFPIYGKDIQKSVKYVRMS